MAEIGIFGGSFNPIHSGHLAIARAALADLRLDRLYVVPAALNPFKTPEAAPEYSRLALATGFTAEERMEMIRAACADDPRLVPSDLELRRGGVSYAIDTVRAIAAAHPGAALHFVIGEDSTAGLGRWKDIEALRALCSFAVYPRTYESSTEIRRRLAAGEPVDGLMPPAAAALAEEFARRRVRA